MHASEESLRKLPKGDEPDNGRNRQKIQFPAPSLSRKTGANLPNHNRQLPR